MNVGAYAEVSPKQQGFAVGNVELGEVVGDAIFQSWIIDGDLTTVAGEIEPKQVSSQEGGPRRAENHVTLILRPKRAAADESKPRRCDFKFPRFRSMITLNRGTFLLFRIRSIIH